MSRIKIVLASVGLFVPIAYRLWKNGDVRRMTSSLVQKLAREPDIESDVSRDVFAQTVLAPPKTVEGHTHASAAALRSSASHFAYIMALTAGARLYSLSMSRSDQRKGILGERQWFWAKDTNTDNRKDVMLSTDVKYLCDVDYYVDMPHMLASGSNPVLLYTVVPEDAASSCDDTSFYFEKDGTLTTIISGGGQYNHLLWDYGADSLIAEKKFFGFVYASTVYAVERRQVGYSRQLILLAPIKRFVGLSAFLASFILEGNRVKRFNPIVVCSDGTSFVRFKVHRKDGTYYTTARPGSHLCATVPAALDECIATAARLATTNLMMPTTASWLEKSGRQQAVVLTEFYRVCLPSKQPTVYPLDVAVRAYSYEPKTYEQSERPKLQAFMTPIVHSAFAPVPNVAAERACIKGRIDGLKKKEPAHSIFVDNCMNDFVELVVGETVLEPVGVDQVIEKQTSAAQKLSLRLAMLAGPFAARILKCFIKSEAYSDVKDPRNISTYNHKDKLSMSQFALALSEHLKQFPWYGPGKTPLEIASRVAQICSNAEFVNQSDYHRMDGTISYKLRLVDTMIFMKAFKNHRTELHELIKRNVDNIGILPYGSTFEQGPSHGSGCAATSTSQTLRAAFTAYLGYRNAYKPDGSRYGKHEAFDALGIHLGDDGLDADLPTRNHEWAASKVGLELEASVVHKGDRGVNFLARYYSPEVWFGRLDSMCDVRRQLSKFHTTVRMPNGVCPEDKLVEKARGYVATDGNTPVIGALCKRAVALCGAGRQRASLGLAHWWARFEDSVQFPNNNVDGWMDAEFCILFPEFDRQIFDEWLKTTSHLRALLGPPLCAEPKPATPTVVEIVVDGDVLPAKTSSACTPTTDAKATVEAAASRKRTRKRVRTAKKESIVS